MSIWITDPNLIEKIASVENGGWKHDEERSHTTNGHLYSVWGAVKAWNERDPDNEYFSRIIYGNGGWNRYFVRTDGLVVFSKYHAATGSMDKAIAAGFDIE